MSLLTLTDAVTPQLIVHISAGSLAILSGAAALSVRKGARLHRVFGTVFFLSILAMSVMGAYLAVLIPQRATAVVGLFTFYFVATAWMTVKRREGTTGAFEIAACVFAFAAAAVLMVMPASIRGSKFFYVPEIIVLGVDDFLAAARVIHKNIQERIDTQKR